MRIEAVTLLAVLVVLELLVAAIFMVLLGGVPNIITCLEKRTQRWMSR